MPLYEYRCENCNETFEVRQKFADEPLTSHAKCGGKATRLLSAPGLHFKGSGFYITDYAKAGSAPAKSGGESKGAESKSSETKTESKPAATTTTTKTD
ncbi:MAG: zinc ribbon domain-containing protein [Acidobacteria bacterium]|nr:zinc ribbon domain-containing protein [Acidobacteriota bacterium]